MKLSKIKAMLLTLLTLGTAGMAQMVNYCQIDPYTVSGGFTYTRCEDGKTSDIIMYFYSWPTFLDDGFKFNDRFQTAVKTNRRIILDFFGVDDSTTFYLYNRKIDYGYFKKIEGKPCQSTLLWRDTLQWSGSGNIENHTLAYHKSRSEIVSAVREAGFRKYRVAIWKYEYLSTDLNKWNSPPDYDGSYYTHDDLLFDDYKDFVPIFGSVSWYVSSYIHDGVETTYTADDYPKAYDFIRSKDNILLKIPVNPNGDTTKGVLQYNDGSEWRTDPDYQEDVFKKEKNVTLRFNGTSTGGDHLERLMNKSTGQALIRYRMYKEGATDTLYTPEIKLNIQYLVNWGSTNNVNRGKEWVQGFEDREGKINVAAGVVDYGKTAVLVAEPKDGFDFECWKNESGDCVANAATYNENGVKRFKTNITVKSDTTLSASYIPLYKIFYYDSDGNTRLDESAYVKKGESVSAPANKPTRDGYTFYGWYVTYDPGVMKNPENYPQYKFDFTKAVSDEVYCSAISGCNETFDRFVTLYAAYTVNKHNVVYKVDGEVYKTVENVAYGTDLKTIAAPTASTKTGYTFSGWSTLPATMPDEDVVVTGTFTVNKHYVVYKVDDDPYAVVLNVPYGKDLRVTDEE
ncbi:MAG: InlB B-repeat-containing protein, partial [Fibrobacteraceae bacterium]|nr:InlB B-repeat-containing protein [Fibrobacteraceae bacterium]